MKAHRVERTLLHHTYGVFRYAEELANQGLTSPSEQIVAIGQCLVNELGQADVLPRLSNEAAVTQWMHEALTHTARRLRQQPFPQEPLERLALRAGFFVAWNPYQEFALLLNTQCGADAYRLAANRLRTQGFHLEWHELPALTEPFVSHRLPVTVRHFDLDRGRHKETAWLSTVFYRFALNQLISDQKNRHHLKMMQQVQTSSTSPEAELANQDQQRILQALPQAIQALPNKHKMALELYFGFQDREHTLSEIAQHLNISPYLTRTTIVNGLARLATMLNVQGILEAKEYNILNMFFGEGLEITQAAKRLQMTPKQVQQMLTHINSKFRQSLRPRTSPVTTRHQPSEQESTMTQYAKLSDAQIMATLEAIREPPAVRHGQHGELLADLGDYSIPLARIRKLAAQPDYWDQFDKLEIPLAWLAIPEATTERADLLEDAAEWSEALQALDQRSAIAAEALYYRCTEEASRQHVTFADGDKQTVIDRLHETWTGVSQAIEAELPIALRREGMASFRIDWRDAGQAACGWESDPRGLRFDLYELLEDCATMLGAFAPQASKLFSQVCARDLRYGDVTPPGFRRIDESTMHTTLLQWVPPTLEAEMELLHET